MGAFVEERAVARAETAIAEHRTTVRLDIDTVDTIKTTMTGDANTVIRQVLVVEGVELFGMLAPRGIRIVTKRGLLPAGELSRAGARNER